MIKALLKTGVFALTFAAICACGGPGYQALSPYCSAEFIADYGRVHSTLSKKDKVSRAKEFLAKYPGVECKANRIRRRNSDLSVKISADASMEKIISSLDK